MFCQEVVFRFFRKHKLLPVSNSNMEYFRNHLLYSIFMFYSCESVLQKLISRNLWRVLIWCIILKVWKYFVETLYFCILYTPLSSIVKLKISSSMNFLTNKKSLLVFENYIKIEQIIQMSNSTYEGSLLW